MKSVTVYTTTNCAACEAVKAYLRRHGVPFAEKNVREDEGALAEMIAKANVRIAPVTVVGNEVFYGTFEDQRDGLARALELPGVAD